MAMCGHRHSPRPSASRSSEAVAHTCGEEGPARATWISSRAGTAQGPGSTHRPRFSPSWPPSGCSLASYLSKELGAECVPLRVAWRSPTLTKAWQGAVRSRDVRLGELNTSLAPQDQVWTRPGDSCVWEG